MLTCLQAVLDSPTPADGSYAIPCNKSEKLIRTVHPSVSYGHLERLKDRSVYALSSGERQLISILSAWAMDTDIFLLDEPTANLDFAATQQLKEILLALKTQGKTLLLSEHRLCDVQPYSIQKGVFHHVHCAGPRFGDSFYHFCHVFRCVNGMAVMLRRGWRRSSGASAQGFPTVSVSLPRRQASRPKQQEPAP